MNKLQLHGFARLGWLVLLVAVLLLLQNATPAQAQGTTSITISPPITFLNTGNTAAVNVLVNDYTNLYGADITVSYDQTKVSVQDDNPFMSGVNVTVGPLLGSGDFINLTNTATNATGTIRFVISQLAPTPAQSCTSPCSGVLLTIHFLGVSAGVSPVNITFQKLSNPSAIQIPATVVNGVINIGAPTAATVTAFHASKNQSTARLQWETGSEANLLGFNVWQSEQAEAGYVKRNSAMIAAKTPGGLAGNGYEYVDAGVAASGTYFYKLEVVHIDSSVEWMGPVTVGDATACAAKPLAAKLLLPVNNATLAPQVTLDWSDAVCASAYRVQVRRDGNKGATAQNVRVDASTLTTTLGSGHAYFWRVRTLGEGRRSKWSEWRMFAVR